MSLETKDKIQNALKDFSKGKFFDNSIGLFKALGYKTERQSKLSRNNYKGFLEEIPGASQNLNATKALTDNWLSIELLFQLTQTEMSRQSFLFDTGKVDNTIIEAYLFFAIELKEIDYTRTQLSDITRELNKVFSMPVMVLFKHGKTLTLSVIKRRLHKRDGSKDVLEKITLIKDINIAEPHRAHIEILYDLSFDKLQSDFEFRNFVELHNAWQKTLDSSELNKRFYKELANWYFWAVDNVEFPDDVEKDREKRNSTNVIRMLTRLIFVWFLKEKDNLIPDELFNKKKLDKLLDYKDKNNSTYYKAILQNLFFATLNTEMNKDVPDNRTFIKRQFGIQEFYRYERFFKDKEAALQLFENIPFLNGGLFENLDKNVGETNEQRIDCFSNNRKNEERLSVPDFLFFETEKSYDKLNKIYDTSNKKYVVRGLLEILNKYKFTIHENTPIEEEIALDPELLGKVFENLLASYNEETKTTARKLTGSFYTPREVVNYMVEESLMAYLNNYLAEKNIENLEAKLRDLFSYNENEPQFTEKENNILIEAIDNCKIVDPACGSGAYPMGILHKMVFILGKLDPHNERWMQRQIDKVYDIPDSTLHENLKAEIEKAFNENFNDYGRKLYLIENCIYGVDIQPIAVQIAKLRFFISLIVDQKVNRKAKNLGIRPLPNLETKFVAGNTLIGIERPKQMSLRNSAIDDKEKLLRDVRERHFNARTPATKKKYRERDKELRKDLADLLESDGFKPEATRLMASWDPYDQNKFAGFFDSEWMFGLQKGFDVVIGNPPYFQIQKLDDRTKNELIKQNFITYSMRGDLYELFYEKGIQILKDKGFLAYITSNKWLRANYGKSTRNFFLTETNPLKLLDFGQELVFESAIVHSNILLVQKAKNQNSFFGMTFKKEFSLNNSLHEVFEQNKVSLSGLDSEVWAITENNIGKLKSQLEGIGVKLCNWKIHISYGIKTGFNEAFIIAADVYKELSKTKKNLERIKKVVRGRDTRKYFCNDSKLWIIVSPYQRHKHIENEYPEIYSHLHQFKKDLEKRGQVTNGQHHWLELDNNPKEEYFKLFENDKIIFSEIVSSPQFHYDTTKLYPEATTFFIYGEHLKYLTAFLNSKTITFCFKTFYAGGELVGKYRYKKSFLENLPIPKPTDENESAFENIVEWIAFLKTDIINYATASLLEDIVDAMVNEVVFYNSVKEQNALVIDLVKKQIPDFNQFDDEPEKLKAIEKVYKKINESNNEIRNRIIKQNIAVEEVKLINQSLSKHAHTADTPEEL